MKDDMKIDTYPYTTNKDDSNPLFRGKVVKDDMKIEMEAHKNQQLERIAEFMKNNSKVSNSTGLEEENKRLKIKNNKMKRLLKDLDYWLGQELNLNYFKGEIMSFVLTKDYIMEEQKKKIEEVLKKVEE